MLGSRHRHVSLSRKDVPKLWQTESDNERPRQPMNPVQRPNIEYGTPLSNDRNHRQYKRPDADQAYATAHAHYQTTTTSQPIAQPMAAVAASSSSRMRTQDDPYAYLKRKTTERRSPRSSEERLYAPDQGRPSRSSTQARGPSVPQGASQSYYAQPTRDPAVSQRDRDREKAETRDRKRLEKEAARLRAEEEKMRARAYERERDRERERRREEKELRRAEREREKEQERRREEKEQERARRHKEKERAREQSRGRDINPVYPQSATAQISAAAGALRQYANSKLLSRQQPTDQIPSSSSNLALPQHIGPGGSSTRLQTTTEARRDESTQGAPPHVPEKDKKRHRTHRDRATAQQSGQESGFSSSEQEQSGRERPYRGAERRYTSRDPYDTHQSGPSGSENERNPRERVRRSSRAHVDGYGGDSSRGGQPSGSVQPSIPVGSASSQRYATPIVSIRAGQGPADPSTPQLFPKPPLGQGRSRDVAYGSTPMPAQAPPTSTAQGYLPQSQNIQQGPSRQTPSQPLQDNVSRLHNVLGISQQAPLPPLPPDASTQYLYADQSAGRPSYTPPSTQLQQPSGTPMSLAPGLSVDPTSGRSNAVSGTENRQPAGKDGSPDRMVFSSDPIKQSPAHMAKLNVYRGPGPAVSAEVTLPTGSTHLPDGSTQYVTVTETSVKDLAARFPLNEDMLTSASSSTLANQSALPGYTPPQQRRESVEQARPTGFYPSDPQPHPNSVPTPASQNKSLGYRNGYEENDVPIPIPSRNMNSNYPSSAPYQSRQADESRGQKQTLPPLPNATPPSQQARPQATPLQPRSAGAYGYPEATYGTQYTSARPPQNTNLSAPSGMQVSSSLHPSNYSPARSVQQTMKGSPASGTGGVSLANMTPKHSPSGRLAARNGSTDTVQAAFKSSPNHPTKSVNTSYNTNAQPNGSSRPDTNPTRQTNITSEYPDNGRYRSQTPAYPTSAPPQQSSYLPTQTTIPNYQPSQPSVNHHSRSMSQPAPPALHEPYPQPARHQTIPGPSIATVAATAPSASAIVAAYRNSEQSKAQDAANQRVPPRAAPSPAPTVTGRPYTAQPISTFSKTGFAMTSGVMSPPPRGQTLGGPPPTTTGGHSRSQSDSQYPGQPSRVPVAGHLSTPAPPKAQLAYHPSPSELSLLKTPSSIAPSMAKSPLPPARPPSVQASKSSKSGTKKGIFGLFRSRSSPPKQDARVPEQPNSTGGAAAPANIKPRQRSSSQTTITAVAASVRNIIAPHPAPPQQPRAPSVQPSKMAPPQQSTTVYPVADPARRAPPPSAPPASIIAPKPIRPQGPGGDQAVPNGRRSPGTKMFTPFRLLSRHHRTVSAASVEALDGTAANTVIGGESARSSTAGRPSPPLRDPFAATQDWRNREEEDMQGRGTYRRRRPGVVFDVREEFTDTETHHPARKLSRGERR